MKSDDTGASTFDSLVENLSEKERKDFLEKIRKSLNFEESNNERIYREQTNQEERNVRIQNDLRKISPFRSILFFVVGVFTGKKKEELLYRQKMKELRKIIQKKAPRMVGFESKSIKTNFPEKIFSLYLSTLPLYHFFSNVWREREGSLQLQDFFFRLVDSELEEENTDIYSFYPFSEIVEDYKKRGSSDDLFKELNRRVDRYVDKIPSKHFKVVEDILRPLYYMKDLVLFSFRSFFELFHGVLLTDNPERKPLFKPVSALVTLEALEDFFYVLYNASKAEVEGQLKKDWVKEVFSSVLDSKREGETTDDGTDNGGEKNVEGPPSPSADRLLSDLTTLSKKVHKTMKEIPLKEIIRYFRKDPYYKLVVYMPKFDVVSFYREIKKMSLNMQLQQRLSTIMQHALKEERDILFEGYILKELHNYRIYSSIDYEKMGIPPFSYHKALLVLYNYIIHYYKQEVQRLIQICQQAVPQQDRITRDRIVKHAATSEDVGDKIIELDNSLSEEKEEGKAFQRLRFQNSIDSEQKRLFRSLVAKKDREAKDLLEKGTEAIGGLKKIFTELLQSRERQIQETLSKKFLFRGKPIILRDAISDTVERITTLQQMLDQYARIRAQKGSDESLE